MTCPDCTEGERIINPDWPSGTEPYSEKCSTCGGSGAVANEEGTDG
jgi:DnaJ-class molecular chaperone